MGQWPASINSAQSGISPFSKALSSASRGVEDASPFQIHATELGASIRGTKPAPISTPKNGVEFGALPCYKCSTYEL